MRAHMLGLVMFISFTRNIPSFMLAYMFKNPFSYIMAATFLGAVITMAMGVGNLGRSAKGQSNSSFSNQLMMLRVLLCGALVVEILLYTAFFRN